MRGEVRGPFPLRRLRSTYQSTCRAHQASGANGGDLLWRSVGPGTKGVNDVTTTKRAEVERLAVGRWLIKADGGAMLHAIQRTCPEAWALLVTGAKDFIHYGEVVYEARTAPR